MAVDPRIALAGQPINMQQALGTAMQQAESFRTRGVRELILEQKQQQQAMDVASQQGQYLNQLASGLMSKPLDQRAAIVAQQLPFLTQIGINPSQILSQDLTDQGLQSVVMQTQPFMQRSAVSAPAGVQEFQYLTEGLTPEQVQQAKLVELGLAPRAVTAAPKLVTVGSAQFMQIGDKLYNPQTMAEVDPSTVAEGETPPAPQPVTLTPQAQAQQAAEAAAIKAQAEAAVELEKQQKLAEIQLAKEEAQRAAQEIIKQQGQLSTLADADIAYKALKEGNLERIYGFGESLFPDFLRSSEGALLQARLDQLTGMLVKAGKGELKGQGPVTDADQTIIAQAATILNNQSIPAEEARKALDEAMNVLYRGAGKEFKPENTAEDEIDSFLNSLGL